MAAGLVALGNDCVAATICQPLGLFGRCGRGNDLAACRSDAVQQARLGQPAKAYRHRGEKTLIYMSGIPAAVLGPSASFLSCVYRTAFHRSETYLPRLHQKRPLSGADLSSDLLEGTRIIQVRASHSCT